MRQRATTSSQKEGASAPIERAGEAERHADLQRAPAAEDIGEAPAGILADDGEEHVGGDEQARGERDVDGQAGADVGKRHGDHGGAERRLRGGDQHGRDGQARQSRRLGLLRHHDAGRDGTRLQKIKRVAGKRPFEVEMPAEHGLALMCQRGEALNVAALQAGRLDQLRRDLHLLRAVLGRAADGGRLVAEALLQQSAVARDPVMVRRHHALHHRFAQPPGRFDDELVGAGQRVAREQHAGGARVDELLHHGGDADRAIDPLAPTIGDSAFAVRRIERPAAGRRGWRRAN